MNTFLPLLFRMKYINRWGLMRNSQTEDLTQHTVECALITHYLALVGNTKFKKDYDVNKLTVRALYHDAAEVLTGDLPTPVKYYNDDIRRTYKQIEKTAADQLLRHLPDELRGEYSLCLSSDSLSEAERRLLKAADKLCALIKCKDELNAGNMEFKPAYSAIKRDLDDAAGNTDITGIEELRYFLDNCLDAFSLPLDELGGTLG